MGIFCNILEFGSTAAPNATAALAKTKAVLQKRALIATCLVVCKVLCFLNEIVILYFRTSLVEWKRGLLLHGSVL